MKSAMMTPAVLLLFVAHVDGIRIPRIVGPRICVASSALPRISARRLDLVRCCEAESPDDAKAPRRSFVLPRIAALSLSIPAAFFGYLSVGRVLDKTLVAEFAVNRAGADAFGPFVTLLGLIYSILLAQSYEYYFTRQGTIQDALYEEVMSLQQLYEAITALTERHPSLAAERGRLLGVLRTHSASLLRLGFSDDTKLLSRSSLELHRLLETIEVTTAGRSAQNLLLAGNAVGALSAARARRISAVAARLPLIQSFALRIIAVVLLLGFLLVDLGSPRLEALLFSVVSGVFVLINYFLSDLSDPFGGSWNVEPAREELSTLLTRLEGEGDGTLPQPVPTDEDGAPVFDSVDQIFSELEVWG